MKYIENYEGLYSVTDDGRVYSHHTNKFLKLSINTRTGYVYVVLSKQGKVKKFFVHRLVAMAYIPNPENKEEVNHEDLDKKHNYVNNLTWATPLENSQHAIKNGAIPKNPQRLFSTDQVKEIRNLFSSGKYTKVKLGELFNAGDLTIGLIIRRITYKEID